MIISVIIKNCPTSATRAGSVDGCTKKNEMTVDRLDLETHLGILDSVNDILKKELDVCAIA